MPDPIDGLPIDERTALIEKTFNTTVNFIAGYEDWVRTHDGTPATVIHAQPVWDATRKRSGAVYTLMFRGGHERTYHHLDGDNHLTLPTYSGPGTTEPLFTVIDPDNMDNA